MKGTSGRTRSLSRIGPSCLSQQSRFPSSFKPSSLTNSLTLRSHHNPKASLNFRPKSEITKCATFMRSSSARLKSKSVPHLRTMATETPIRKPPGSSDVFFTPKTWTTGVGIGLIAGFFGGVVGQGGGVVAVPLMTGLAHLTQHQAHGTSLVMVAATGLAGALSYYNNPPIRVIPKGEDNKNESENENEMRNKEGEEKEEEVLHGVDFGAALLMCMGASLFARMGAVYTKQLTEKALKKTLGYFMLASSMAVASKAAYTHFVPKTTPTTSTPTSTVEDSIEKDKVVAVENTTDTQPQPPQPQQQSSEQKEGGDKETKPPVKLSPMAESYVNRWHIYMATGCFTGFAAGMLGVGGGIVMVPALTMFTDMHQSQILGSSLLAMVPPAMIGAFAHYKQGHVILPLLAPILLGTTLGAYLGGKFSTTLTETQQRGIVASVVFGLALNTLAK